MLYFDYTKRYTTADNRKGIIKMTKNTFVNRLSARAEITQEQSRIVVDAIEDHNLFAKEEKDLIVSDIAQQLGCGEKQAQRYFCEASRIIRSEIKDQAVMWIAGTTVVVIAGIVVMRMRKNKDKEK
jgi:nucleoid DNA-binding protein